MTNSNVDAHMLNLVEEVPLAFLMVVFVRLRNAVYGIIATPRTRAPFATSQYLELLPLIRVSSSP